MRSVKACNLKDQADSNLIVWADKNTKWGRSIYRSYKILSLHESFGSAGIIPHFFFNVEFNKC